MTNTKRKTEKYLVGAAITVLAVVAVIPTASAQAPQERSTPAPTVSVAAATTVQPTASVAERKETVISPSPASANRVLDDDLLKLSALVNLPNAEERHINKDQWSRALPVAQRLAQGSCDCEQRNWLNHFIEMGNAALAGSDEKYYNLAALMRKMARNDQQLTADPGRIMR